jgi:pantoate--beta-alanine ligase
MSSRNSYLSEEERAEAPVLRQALLRAQELFNAGETDVGKVLGEVRAMIESKPHAEVQYISAVDWKSMAEARELRAGTMLALAVFFGSTRLIDNLVLGDVGGE